MRKTLFALCFLGASVLAARPIPCAESAVLAALPTADEQSPAWGEARSILSGRFADLDQTRRLLAIEPSRISVTRKLGYGANGAVYAVTVSGESRPLVLKVFRGGASTAFPKAFLPSVAIQEFLGQLGLAPKVRGVLDRDQVKALGLAGGGGILMDSIGEGKVTAKHRNVPPPWRESESTVAKLEYATRALSRLRIRPDDPDLIFSAAGEPYLFDCDAFTWFSDDGRYFSHDAEGEPIDTTKVCYHVADPARGYLRPFSWKSFLKTSHDSSRSVLQ